MDTKCYGCGLVNWQGAIECARCKGKLGVKPVPSSNPFENESPKRFSGFRLAVLLGATLMGSFLVYQMVKVEAPKPVVINIEEQKNMARWLEAEKQEMQRQANIKPIAAPEPLSRTNYDSLGKTAWAPGSEYRPNEKFGGWNGPPPGTVYEHRNGQMQQVR